MTSNSYLELELTYLAKLLPTEIKGTKPQELVDTYVPEDSEFPILRLRRNGNAYEITKKVAVAENDFSAHTEHTISLSRDEHEALSKSSNRIVRKLRYSIASEGHLAEIDIFQGDLMGLVTVDFEFKSEKDKASFTPPNYCLVDVTQEKFILGGQLAGKGYAALEPILEKLGYQPLYLKETVS
jgi:CYTH domain-containing protein